MGVGCRRNLRAAMVASMTVGALMTVSLSGIVFAAGAASASGCLSAQVVTNNADSGSGSLRQAVIDACPGSTISFAGGLASPIALTSGEIAINANLTITGPGASLLSVSGSGLSRVFNVAYGATVMIDGLTITDGGSSSGNGGNGIYNQGSLTMTNSVVTANVLLYAVPGGGISNGCNGCFAATLTLVNSTVSNNPAIDGGGIYNGPGSTVNLVGSTVSNNSANFGGAVSNYGILNVASSTVSGNKGWYFGGGLYNYSGGTMTVQRSMIASNTTTYSGGGIINSSTLTVANSTLYNNSAPFGSGGGVFNTGTMSVIGSTITGNSAQVCGGGIGNGGACAGYQNPSASLTTTLVAGNSAGSSSPDIAGGPFSSYGYNLIGNGDGSAGLTNGVNNDQVGTTASPIDPKLGPLANNGGPTQTFLPASNSPAVGAIPSGTTLNSVAVCPRVDQRGVSSFGKCTIGAVEGGYLISTSSLPNATRNVPYGPVTFTIQEPGTSTSPYVTTFKWAKGTVIAPATALPKGLTLSSAGVLKGTPYRYLAPGTYPVTVKVTEVVTTLNGKLVVKRTTVQATLSLIIN